MELDDNIASQQNHQQQSVTPNIEGGAVADDFLRSPNFLRYADSEDVNPSSQPTSAPLPNNSEPASSQTFTASQIIAEAANNAAQSATHSPKQTTSSTANSTAHSAQSPASESTAIASGLLHLLIGLITKPRILREVALLLDVAISLTLAIFPSIIGKILAVGYFFFRDSLPFLGFSSFGRSIFGLKILRASDASNANGRICFVRNLLLAVPIFNIVDLLFFVVKGRRLTDEWLGTDVVAVK